MPALILLILTSLVQAYTPQVMCFSEDEKIESTECFNAICDNSKNDVIPLDPKAFQMELANHQYSFPAEQAGQLNQYLQKYQATKLEMAKFYKTKGPQAIAAEILKNPYKYKDYLEEIVSDDMAIISGNGQTQIIISDFADKNNLAVERMSEFLRMMGEASDGFSQVSLRVKAPGAKEFYLKMAQDMKSYFAATAPTRVSQIDALIAKIESSPSLLDATKDISTYFKSNDLAQMMLKKFPHIKQDVAEYVQKHNANRGLDQTADHKKRIVNGCKMVSFVRSKMKDKDFQKEFNEAVGRGKKGFNEVFLPKLSDHTRKFLSELMTKKDPFEPFEMENSIYPDFKTEQQTLASYRPMDMENFINVSTALKDGLNSAQCSSGTIFPEDYYSDKIFTSYFTLALGYQDVLSHELGHWVSDHMGDDEVSGGSRKTFENLRSCISGFYLNETKDKTATFSVDTIKTEEDFADWFDATINMNYVSRFTCDVTKMTESIVSFLVGSKDVSIEETYLPKADDTHSNDLFRELHLMMIKGISIPVSCQKLMDNHPEAQPKKCDI